MYYSYLLIIVLVVIAYLCVIALLLLYECFITLTNYVLLSVCFIIDVLLLITTY